MADNHANEEAPAGEEGGFSPKESFNGTAADSSGDSVDQMDPASLSNTNPVDSFRSEPTETRDDMFVDCPDEIENSESQQSSEEKHTVEDDQYNESDSGINVQQLMSEIEVLRDTLDNTVAEKEKSAVEYEEERSFLTRELSQFRNQIRVLSEKNNSVDENANGVVDHIQTMESGASLHEIMDECSRFLKSALDERLQTDEQVRELQSAVYMKDQDIGFLNAKVAQAMESSNIAQSDSNLNHVNMSRQIEVLLEKDQQIEEIVNRILASVSLMHHEGDLLDGSLTEKISSIEKSVTFLVEKCNLFVSESDQLRGFLNEVGLDFDTIDGKGTFVAARDKILDIRSKEENLYQNLSNLEDENRKLIEQLEQQKSTVENVNAEISRLRVEVEQEKNRYANTKEKLTMAVTKGKALVQQRDSLKQLLAEKTSQLEKYSIELQEKSSALDAAENTKELIAEKDKIVQKCGEILSEIVATKELQPTDDITEKLRWLVDENKSLSAISLQYNKLADALSLFDFPETVASSELDLRVRFLAESFDLSKEEAIKLQSEIAKTKEAANGEIDHLTASLLAEMQERSYLQAEVDDLRNKYEALKIEIDHLRTSLSAESQEKSYLQLELESLRDKYEGVVQKEHLVSLEKDKIVSLLMEASGLANNGSEEIRSVHSDITITVDSCLAKIKENMCPSEPSQVHGEIFENVKSLLYIKDQEMSLYKLIIEEDILDRVQVSYLSGELERKTEELNAVKDEKAVVQKSLAQMEDRCALLKDKLSMAVKKGKGLVQERETLKGSLNEKNVEIDRLKFELQQNLDRDKDCQDQITKLSVDVERIPLLETDLVATKERADQLEQFLAESNGMLQRAMESIDGITTPTDSSFSEPIEKLTWIAGYLSEQEILRTELEQDLREVKDEASSLASKLSDVEMTIKSLENALSIAENSRSQLLDEKKELEVSKAYLEEELQKENEKTSSHTSNFEELSASKRALEDALLQAEEKISTFMNERDTAVESRDLAEEQLQKLKDDFSDHITRLADADKTIQSLEDALSQAQKNISLLSEENSKVQIGSADLDSEIKKIREEAHSHASKFSEASVTIKSLEDALLNAENNMGDLVQEKRNAEQEIIALKSQLESCMEELVGIRGSIETRFVELSSQLNHLWLLLKDEALPLLLGKCFERKFESLNDINVLLKEMGDYFLEMDPDMLQDNPVTEDDSSLPTTLPSSLDIALNLDILDDEVNAVDIESIMLYIEKMNEGFHLKGKIMADKFGKLSTLMDGSIASLLRRLHVTKDRVISITRYAESLKQRVENINTDKQRQEDTIASLESEIRILLSACTDATKQLELNAQNNSSELRFIQDYVKQDGRMSMDLETNGDDAAAVLDTDNLKTAEKLLLATRQNQDLVKLFKDAMNKLTNMTEDTRNQMKAIQLTCDEVSEERDLYKDKISMLETDLKEQQNLSHDMTIKLEDYKEKEDELRKREAELSTSLSKVHELEDPLLSASQVKYILEKMNEVEVPDVALAVGDSHDSADVRKLFYVIDSYNGFLQRVSSLSLENEELQSIADNQILEIEHLQKQLEDLVGSEKDSEKLDKLLELESGLQNIVRKLGVSDEMDVDLKADRSMGLMQLLDRLVMTTVVESESLKSKNEELGAKLFGAQKVVDDLSNKIKFLEDSNQTRNVPLEIVEQGRGTSITSSPQSEISEVQDMEAIGKSNNAPHVLSAAHIRTMRKGSSDHLAINIDSDSERLINNKETDEDKGRIFKSLNTSGLVPRQGKSVADRIDGYWVTGSRALMNHPRGRLGLIAYWLVLHMWLLGTIL
ncbi:hypothetical protein ACP275_11G064900 [Erythranthe tilingii]